MQEFYSASTAIAAVVEKYFTGVTTVNMKLLEEAIDADATHLKSVVAGADGLEKINTESGADAMKRWAKGTANLAKGDIIAMDVIDDRIAIVQFDFRFGEKHFLDILQLAKMNGAWKIVNKMFVLR
ncbi:MAG: nuclear transport factor 2 family protein [Rhodoferax sp.]|nr:nuclear transport factor 2 family protein [Rhodoferax sp.]